MYLRKMRPSTTCLYSAASMLLRSLSAACQSLASKPMLAEELSEFLERARAIREREASSKLERRNKKVEIRKAKGEIRKAKGGGWRAEGGPAFARGYGVAGDEERGAKPVAGD